MKALPEIAQNFYSFLEALPKTYKKTNKKLSRGEE